MFLAQFGKETFIFIYLANELSWGSNIIACSWTNHDSIRLDLSRYINRCLYVYMYRNTLLKKKKKLQIWLCKFVISLL